MGKILLSTYVDSVLLLNINPLNLNSITPIAKTDFRGNQQVFGIKPDDRRRHMYVVGKTGMGKSVLLTNMIISDLRAGNGLAVIDPHGDLAENLLDYVPSNRINDCIYFNPADQKFPIAFNVLESVEPEQRSLVASGLVSVFQKIWADSWGPRLEYVLRNALLALLERPGSSLVDVMRLLSDKGYRTRLAARIQDPVVKMFWQEEFARYPDRFLQEVITPVQNKVGQFLSSPLIRNIVGQPKSKLNFRRMMDERQVLIVNLAKGKLGEDNAALLGALIVNKLQLAAVSRVDIPEKRRQDFYLYVDEFQHFATRSFADLLAEARKYRLNLTLAHQFLDQLEPQVCAAVLGNVGTMLIFCVGPYNAKVLGEEVYPEFEPRDLMRLAKYHVVAKLMIDGQSSRPFTAVTLPPKRNAVKEGHREIIMRISRERYGCSCR